MQESQILIRVTSDGVISAEIEGQPAQLGDVVEVTISKVVMRSENPMEREGRTCNVVKIVSRDHTQSNYVNVQRAPQLNIREFICPITAVVTENVEPVPVTLDPEAMKGMSETIEKAETAGVAGIELGATETL